MLRLVEYNLATGHKEVLMTVEIDLQSAERLVERLTDHSTDHVIYVSEGESDAESA